MSYVVADEPGNLWGHLFEEDSGTVERMCKFAYDLDEEELVAAQVQVDGAWEEAGRSVLNDLEDSLKDANPDALDDPEAYGLLAAEELPEWAAPAAAPAP